MTKKLLLIFFFMQTIVLFAQNDIIKTINFSDDYTFLQKELKGVQIVMLGERTHNDGNVFELKTDIIKYLYKEMGFRTIAFESGTYELWKAEQEIKIGKSATKAFKNSIFPIWSETLEFQSFITFFEKNHKDLNLYGFDNQITGKYGEEQLVNDLYNYCKKQKIPFKLNQTDLELLIESMVYSGIFDEKDITYKIYNTTLKNLLQEISEKPTNEMHFYWSQIIKNLISLGEEYYHKKQTIISTFNVSKDDNIRDKQMADNLLAYINQHPNEKIICWGANAHFINNMSSIESDTVKDFIPMGSYVKNKLKNKMYSLATITSEDSIKLAGQWHKTPIDESSFEWFLKQQNKPYLFISSNQKSLDKERLNRLFSPITFINSNLSQLHDGYIYLDKAIPSTFITDTESENMPIKIENNKISGQIIDVETKDPIAFANILIKDSYVGTSSDANGHFELYFPNSFKNKSIIISSIGFETLTINAENISSVIELNEETTQLEKVIITSKISTNTIITKVIENFKENYPTQHFNATQYANAQLKIGDTTVLDFDLVLDYYNRGYTRSFRPTQIIKELRWNKKEVEPSKKVRLFFEGEHNSIVYVSFLWNKRKVKKFNFTKEKEEAYQGKDIYIIRFNTDRNHFNYTSQRYFSQYSGYLYITKEDFSVIKIIENWNVTDYPEDLKLYPNLFLEKNKAFNKVTEASLETNYRKNKNGKYYLEKSIYEEKGKLLGEKNIIDYEKVLNSFWYRIKNDNIKEIPFKSENDEFKNVKYNKAFWNTYQFPDEF